MKNEITKLANWAKSQDELNKEICEKINHEILQSQIIFGNIIIKPLWVEAYYHQINGGKHKCGALHGNNKHEGVAEQRGIEKQFTLYFHKKAGTRGGVDLVLSNDEITLSILLKYVELISSGKNEYLSQAKLKNKIFKSDRQNCKIKLISSKENASLYDCSRVFAKDSAIEQCAKDYILASFKVSSNELKERASKWKVRNITSNNKYNNFRNYYNKKNA